MLNAPSFNKQPAMASLQWHIWVFTLTKPFSKWSINSVQWGCVYIMLWGGKRKKKREDNIYIFSLVFHFQKFPGHQQQTGVICLKKKSAIDMWGTCSDSIWQSFSRLTTSKSVDDNTWRFHWKKAQSDFVLTDATFVTTHIKNVSLRNSYET